MMTSIPITRRIMAGLCVLSLGVMLVGCSHSDEPAATATATATTPSKGGMQAGGATAGQVPGSELKVGTKVKDQ
jgi:hypothetical protein